MAKRVAILVAMGPPKTIRIAAAVITRPDGRVLLVRKRGTDMFMQPGGKMEPGELPVAALCRELFEELGLCIDPAAARYAERFRADAANEPGWTVDAEIFDLQVERDLVRGAEIEEIVWVDPAAPAMLRLAKLTRDQILPRCCARQRR